MSKVSELMRGSSGTQNHVLLAMGLMCSVAGSSLHVSSLLLPEAPPS